MTKRTFLAPEVIQTSLMDCGPATLKCLMEGHGVPISYGRLREAVQTDVDGTSIDTLEEVANQLGLEVEQVMLPTDHLLLSESGALPALMVVRLGNGNLHFVIVWRTHGSILQVMDPATGRRWPAARRFLDDEVFIHSMPVPAGDWVEWIASDDFLRPFRQRLAMLGIESGKLDTLINTALAAEGWYPLAVLDAAARMVAALVATRTIRRGAEAADVLDKLIAESAGLTPDDSPVIPEMHWMVRPADPDEDGTPQLLLRGAVLLRVKGAHPAEGEREELAPSLAAALDEAPAHPLRVLIRLLGTDGWLTPGILALAALLTAGGRVLEILLARSVLDLGLVLGADQRVVAVGLLLAFLIGMLLLEAPLVGGLLRLGRHLEVRLRMAFLQKLPRLGDQYFRSRLTSDMAERIHNTHRIREMPFLGGRVIQLAFELLFTTLALIWLDPAGAPLILLTAACWITIPLLMRPLVEEADLRVRSLNGAISRFYLNALQGLVAIKAHGAMESVRREHDHLLNSWMQAGLYHLRIAFPVAGGVQYLLGWPLIAAIVLSFVGRGGSPERLLLLVYWSINIFSLGQHLMWMVQRYPVFRNITLRLLEPLGAPEDEQVITPSAVPIPASTGVSIRMQDVTVHAAGHTILDGIDLTINAGEHVAVVGASGAGKSSLVGLLLGWHQAAAGQVLVDGCPLDASQLALLRQHTAWIDPSVQLWNRSVLENLRYGVPDGVELNIEAVIRLLDLDTVLSRRVGDLNTPLGESGGLVSGGEGQRVRLARAMLRPNVRLVILDEPFRGLDRAMRRELLTQARRLWQDQTLICVTHDISETQGFDRVLVVDAGRIVEDGSPKELHDQADSRYRTLLEAEERVRLGLWEGVVWRRLRIEDGQLTTEEKAHG